MNNQRHSCGLVPPPALLLLTAVGGTILLTCRLRFFPAVILAEHFSPDGLLSKKYVSMMMQSQWSLGWIFMAVGMSVPILDRLRPVVNRLIFFSSTPIYLLFLFAATFLLVFLAQQYFFAGIPHVTDATSHFFQAKIFCLGRLAATAPPCHNYFFQHNVIMSPTGLWHTKYFPGQALWLALGMKLHISRLCMPLAAAFAGIALVYACQRLFSTVVARICGLLYLGSPMLILLGASYMSHTTFLMFTLCGTALLIMGGKAAKKTPMRLFPILFASGLAFGMAIITRPQDIAIFIVVLSAITFGVFRHDSTRFTHKIVSVLLGGLLPILFLLYWNKTLYDSIFTTGYNISTNPSITPIINDSLGFSGAFTIHIALRNQLLTLLRFNKSLFGWPSSFFFIPFAFMSRNIDWRDLTCVLAVCTGVVMYFFWPYWGFEYEARYYCAITPFLIPLTARGLQRLKHLTESLLKPHVNSSSPNQRASMVVSALLLVFFLHSIFSYWPIYIRPTYAHAYEQTDTLVQDRAMQENLHGALILINSTGKNDFRYSSGFVFNDPLLTNNVIYARNLPGENNCLSDAFPKRTIYRFAPNNDWSDGEFELLRRPQNAQFP